MIRQFEQQAESVGKNEGSEEQPMEEQAPGGQPEVCPDCLDDQKQASSPALRPLWQCLPERPMRRLQFRANPIQLCTNFLKVTFAKDHVVHCYHFSFQPDFPLDQRRRKYKLLKENEAQLKADLGDLFAVSGRNIYVNGKGARDVGKLVLTLRGEERKLMLKKVREIRFSDLLNPETRKYVVLFLNNLFKSLLRDCGLEEIGRQAKFIDNTRFRESRDRVKVYRGYASNFAFLSGGVFLRIDCISKLVRSETVLDVIDLCYSRAGKDESKEDIRQTVRCALMNRSVRARYGNQKYYRVEDVFFDLDCRKEKIKETGQTLMDYYQSKYLTKILHPTAPLLKAKNYKGQGEILLVPELCDMTGLPDGCGEDLRAILSENNGHNPQAKTAALRELMKRLADKKEGFSLGMVREKLGLEISQQPLRMTCEQLNEPVIDFGEGKYIQKNCSHFRAGGSPAFASQMKLAPCLVYHRTVDRNKLREIEDIMQATTRSLKIAYEPARKYCVSVDCEKGLEELADLLWELRDKVNIAIIILNKKGRDYYPKIKQLTYVRLGMHSQVVLSENLYKRGSNSVVTKVVQQAHSKVGNVLWAPRVGQPFRRTMLCGMDITNTRRTTATVDALSCCCSTTNSSMSAFYSCFEEQHRTEIINTRSASLVLQSLYHYRHRNGELPDNIIVLRQGCSEGHVRAILDHEIQDILRGIAGLEGYDPGLLFLAVDKRPHQKFYRDKTLVNPPAGTLIAHSVVSHSNFDFYLIAQESRLGTSVPTYYKALHNSTAFSEDMVQELLYSQCYNYANWAGSIRVPSVLQYARKFSVMIATYLKGTPDEALLDTLFFI